ncbi:FAD/NAD(P)-binding oxidoreductase [Prauserella marina]|uniref:Assimilatory nitrate reductase electron transfer subunit n=1 Tax=Prauserella marina TaxID=530584 RepID=A0A222VKB2_9PSEU|nr:FAD-dependent oxidoreductase [Prauserella marina]ASR34345.1 FAD/NAD(P)-binding oxidoreductase [Prauserella marina]PWV71865.1 assimilatory nitrate reductase electron transfer subunit [Prauserella marina]SDD89601.1 assimilatory nitrate reductase electron transfer subunit [Prauserella marina]
MNRQHVVIVGYGMAGARLADEMRTRDPGGEATRITMIGAEPHHAYNRVLLSSVLAGNLRHSTVLLHDERWAEDKGIDLRIGVGATALDPVASTVTLTDGGVVGYDILVLAMGSRPWLPPVEGLTTEGGGLADGALTFRMIDDCAEIRRRARPGSPVAVLGGGVLGVEAAKALAAGGAAVTVVHPGEHIMERQLDTRAARVLTRVLTGHDIDFRIAASAARYVPGAGLKLDDGSHVVAETVVVSAGVRAETSLADSAGLLVRRGIVVDDALRTNDRRIHAIGDCAEHRSTGAGLVQPAWEQARVLADLLTGADDAARYRGSRVVTRLKARGVDLTALGEPHTDPDEPGAEVLSFDDPVGCRYAKLVLREDRLTGAILLGFPDAAATIAQLHDRGTPAPRDRLGLLLGRSLPSGSPTAASPADLPANALVCRCNSVSKSALVDAWRTGATDGPALRAATRAATGCGSCGDTVQGIADWLADTA